MIPPSGLRPPSMAPKVSTMANFIKALELGVFPRKLKAFPRTVQNEEFPKEPPSIPCFLDAYRWIFLSFLLFRTERLSKDHPSSESSKPRKKCRCYESVPCHNGWPLVENQSHGAGQGKLHFGYRIGTAFILLGSLHSPKPTPSKRTKSARSSFF